MEKHAFEQHKKIKVFSEEWTTEEHADAMKWAADNPHLSFFLRKALAHINYLENKEKLALATRAAGEIC